MKRAWATLFAAFLHFDTSFMVWVILGPLALFIAKDLNLSITQKAFLVSIPPLGGAFFRIILGLLSDQYGAKRVGVASMAITLLPLALGWFAGTTYAMMLAIGFLLGIAGASFAVSLPLASRWFPPERQGIAMGIAGAGNSGTVLSTLFAPRLAAHFGWHATMGLAMIPVLVALVVYAALASDSPTQPTPKHLADYLRVLRVAETWWFCLFYSITFGGFLGFVSYLAIYFNTAFGVDKVAVGVLVAIASLFGSVARPIGGYIADRIGGVSVLRVVFVVFAMLTFAIATSRSLGVTQLLVFGAITCLGAGNGAVFQIVPQRFPKEIGVITGIVGAAGGLGGFYLPNLLGTLRALSGTFASGFVTLGSLALLGAVLITIVSRSWSSSFLTRAKTSYAFALEEA
ncbi:MAG TPA: nitrate/nitrite transporter [Candidatus Acidoferrales bacterium]|nr:nitrate/nitrite transporter [Candidatus Acidoferrales bacterium]